jgi:protein O-GlcNAc transferase
MFTYENKIPSSLAIHASPLLFKALENTRRPRGLKRLRLGLTLPLLMPQIGGVLQTAAVWRVARMQKLTALLREATQVHHQGRLDEAERLYRQILAVDARHPDVLNRLAVVALQRGHLTEAHFRIEAALLASPASASALSNKGTILLALKNYPEALDAYDRSLALNPADADGHYNRARTLTELSRHGEALASYDQTITLRPKDAEAYAHRGYVLVRLARPNEALASFDHAISLQPRAEFYLYRGNILKTLMRHEEALQSYDQALAINPDYSEALNNKGNTLLDLKRPEDALLNYDRAIALDPRAAVSFYNRGNALLELKNPAAALASYDQAIAINGNYAEAFTNRGNALLGLGRPRDALASYDRAIALNPRTPEAHGNRGNALFDLKRPEDALASCAHALALQPDNSGAYSGFARAALSCCDWDQADWIAQTINQRLAAACCVSPFYMLCYSSDPEIHQACARNYIRHCIPIPPTPLWDGVRYNHKEIRLAYLSADFHEHATAHLMAELFELHTRDLFNVIGISYGPDDRSSMRTRLGRSFDRFYDVSNVSDEGAARLLRREEIDIAIDLKGYTKDGRPEILSFRPAPVQVNYLGYPGTMGADFIDYIIADRVVVPLEDRAFYTEKVVELSGCYQVNDRKREIAGEIPTRRAAGLPETGFVFCCFNNNFKITREVFEVWMRLLRQIQGSVLWLLRDNQAAERNLCREAEARGVAATRLVFADRLPLDQHLARHRLADVFLDTLPYNAHTTASDALWAGLPVITCVGKAFPGRVAASLVRGVGLADLATTSLVDYEALAQHLAKTPDALAAVKATLRENRLSSTVFDTNRFVAAIETAYVRMRERSEQGLPPESFRVT